VVGNVPATPSAMADPIESAKIHAPEEDPPFIPDDLRSGSEILGVTAQREQPVEPPRNDGVEVAIAVAPVPTAPARPAFQPRRHTEPARPVFRIPPPRKPVGKAQPFPELFEDLPATAWRVDEDFHREPVKFTSRNISTHVQPGQEVSVTTHSIESIRAMASQGVRLVPVR